MTGKRAGLLQEDYDRLDGNINAKKVYKLKDVNDRIERVAFDVVRFRDSEGFDKLWVVQEQNGDQVLVAMYNEDEKIEAKAWAAIPDQSGNVSVFYKGEPITRLSMVSYGLPNEEASVVCRFLPKKLASDRSFAHSLLSELSSADRNAVFEKHPELKG